MLFKRYASPLVLLDQMIMTGQLYDFVMKMIHEVDHDQLWEYYLNRVYDKSFDDWVASLEQSARPTKMTEREIGTTITNSMNMLTDFTPDVG